MRLFSSPSEVGAQSGDAAWLRAMLDFESAFAGALADVGLAPREAADEIAAVCAAGDGAVRLSARRSGHGDLETADGTRAGGWDLDALGAGTARDGTPVPALLAQLRPRLSAEAQAVLHRGATSQDVVDTAAMLVAKRALVPLLADLDGAGDAAAALAERHRADLAAGRTLLQQAATITFGLRAANWLAGLDDAAARLATVRDERLAVQLGGAAGNLAAFASPGPEPTASAPGIADASGPPGAAPGPTPGAHGSADTAANASAPLGERGLAVTEALAARLGLPAPSAPWHANRSRPVELASALGQAAGAAGKVGTDVVLLAQTEVGEVAEGAPGVSSAMPHKRNPTAAVAAVAAARRTPGLVATMFAAMPGEQERAAGSWQAEAETLSELIRLTGVGVAAARRSLEGLEVFPERMRANVEVSGGLGAGDELIDLALATHRARTDGGRP